MSVWKISGNWLASDEPDDEERNSALNFLNIPDISPASVEKRASGEGIDNFPADIEISHLVLTAERTGWDIEPRVT